jgi:hypothetical protein
MQNPRPEYQSARGWHASARPARSARSTLPRSYALICMATLLLAWPVLAPAQYSIDWISIDAGGGTSTGGVYTISGIIGQPDAGTMTGGNFALAGGFWSIIAAIQTPAAPLLSITRTNTSVILSWPAAAASYSLEQTPILPCSPSTWNTVTTGQYQTNAAEIRVVMPLPPGTMFFRLHRQ